jgi:hypothetical protein
MKKNSIDLNDLSWVDEILAVDCYGTTVAEDATRYKEEEEE